VGRGLLIIGHNLVFLAPQRSDKRCGTNYSANIDNERDDRTPARLRYGVILLGSGCRRARFVSSERLSHTTLTMGVRKTRVWAENGLVLSGFVRSVAQGVDQIGCQHIDEHWDGDMGGPVTWQRDACEAHLADLMLAYPEGPP
jgi:hypothetical protein